MSGAIAVIPARGGSKRIPRKNLRPFNGVPLMQYAIDACHAAGCFAEVVVTSEDADIGGLSQSLGARWHQRPEALADDHTPLAPVVLNVLTGNYGHLQQVAVVLANPFVRAQDLRNGLAMMEGEFNPVASVARLPVPFARVLRKDQDGTLSMAAMEADRTQDLAPAFADAGQWYWTWHAQARHGLLVGALPYELPRERVCDLDTEDDWRTAELMWRFLDGKA